jgi:hypothetical protein
MVYVVERYLPGLGRSHLLSGLSKLPLASEALHDAGSLVSYLGSTIVLDDEACFCAFEGPSEAAVAEANRRAGLPFDRIVPAVLIEPNPRSNKMSISTSIPRTTRLGPSRRLILIAAVAALLAVAAWAITSPSGGHAVRQGTTNETSVLRSLTPRERQYVTGIASLSPAQLSAAFGTDRVPSVDSILASLTAEQRRYVRAIASLSYERLGAAFGPGR